MPETETPSKTPFQDWLKGHDQVLEPLKAKALQLDADDDSDRCAAAWEEHDDEKSSRYYEILEMVRTRAKVLDVADEMAELLTQVLGYFVCSRPEFNLSDEAKTTLRCDLQSRLEQFLSALE